MGLLKAGIGAASGVLADQWREYFYCEALDADTLAAKGQKRTGNRSSNKHGEENIISDGSIVAVADGQCMIIVEDGAIVDVCSEPGKFVYDTGTEPSVFTGNLGENIKRSFQEVGKRFSFGGDTGKDQRIYYFNTKEIIGNKYGTASPVPFRVVDDKIGLDVDITVRCNGEYSYKIVDPLMFYKNVCGNVDTVYTRDLIDSQLKSELLTALQPAFAKISEMGVRYSALPGHTAEIAEALNDVLSEKWANLRGVEIVSFGVNSVKASEEDEAMIKELQKNAVFRNANMAAAHLVGAQAQAMQDAAKNQGGAFTGFMGMNMAQQGGGVNAAQLFQMGAQQQQQPAAPVQQSAGAWTCTCGATATGKFCPECGAKKPEAKPAEGWTCACGAVNTGKFCSECGAKRPAGAPVYCCDKCGWKPADPAHPPKFCPECGDPFDENDRA